MDTVYIKDDDLEHRRCANCNDMVFKRISAPPGSMWDLWRHTKSGVPHCQTTKAEPHDCQPADIGDDGLCWWCMPRPEDDNAS